MDWTNEVIMEFLDLYEHEPVIWDPQNEDRKDRNKVYDAWKRIQTSLSIECSMKDLKKKKENLMATYRKLSLKIRRSGSSGCAAFQVYKPGWFAYEKMSSFLDSVYAPRANTKLAEDDDELSIPSFGLHTEDDYLAYNSGDETAIDIKDEAHSSPASITNESEVTKPPAATPSGPPLTKKRKTEDIEHIEKRMSDAYHLMKQLAAKPKPSKDESALFCDLLCVKLQALDDETREIAMHEINNLMFHYRKYRVRMFPTGDH